MNPNYKEYRFPQIKPIPWEKVFRSRTPREAVDFVGRLLVYDPKARPKPLESLLDPYFDELRDPNTILPNGKPLPNVLFNLSEQEIKEAGYLIHKLIPPHAAANNPVLQEALANTPNEPGPSATNNNTS